MITGYAPMGITPMMGWTYDSTLGVMPKIMALLTNPDKKRYYLLETEPYDPNGMTTVLRTFGAGISRYPGAEDRLWRPRLTVGFNVEVNLFDGPIGLGGDGRPTFGVMQIGWGEESEVIWILRDELSWLKWNQRALRLYLVGDPTDQVPGYNWDGTVLPPWTWTDATLVFSGLAEEAIWNEDTFTIVVRDPSLRLEEKMQTNLYLGTGDDEGSEDLKNKPKPLCFGRPQNISPVLIDRLYLIFQIHDGPILDPGIALDKGDAYAYDGDVADLRAWTAVVGHFVSNNALGMIRLGSTPNGAVTILDVQGASDGGLLREKQGEMIYYILRDRLGYIAADVDEASLARLDANDRQVGIFLRESTETVAQVIDAILLPRGYRTIDTTGRFVAGWVEFGSSVMTLAPPRIISIIRDRTPQPIWRLSLGYSKNWTIMREQDLAAEPETLAIDRDYAIHEFRRVTREDTAVKTRIPGARSQDLDTYWVYETDAQAETDEAWELISEDRDAYLIVAERIQFLVRASETITIVHPRFGLEHGRNFIVLGVAENTQTGQTQLKVWG